MRIRRLVTGLLIAVAILLVIAAVLLAALGLYYKPILEHVIGRAMGAAVKTDKISIDFKKNVLEIRDFTLHNPRGFFEGEILAYLPRINAEYDPHTVMLKRKIRLKTLKLHIMTISIIKDKRGEFNVEQLAIFKEDFQEMPLETEKLILTVDYVIYKDCSGGGKAKVSTFAIDLKDAVYQNFPSLEDVAAKVFSEALRRTTIKGATILGAGVLTAPIGGWAVIIPAEVVKMLSGKDSYQATVLAPYEQAYQACFDETERLGRRTYENKETGIIKADIDEASVTIKVVRRQDNKTDITVSAREFFFPSPNKAGGVLYEIAEKLQLDTDS